MAETKIIDNVLINDIAEWLSEEALREETSLGGIFDGTCKRLLAAGVPLARGQVGFRTLHPLVGTVVLLWNEQDGCTVIPISHDRKYAGWEGSPYEFLADNDVPHLRRRLVGEDAILDYSILEGLRDNNGGTDYIAYLVPFCVKLPGEPMPDGIAGSWLTRRENGFTDTDIAALLRVGRRMALAIKVLIKREVTENIVHAYLGRDAGARVLDGSIQRGDHEKIHAVIWFSDMRRSTALAEELEPAAFFDMVNRYFECTAGAVKDGGGEVLRFIGDAVLAIFTIGRGKAGVTKACKAAIKAAKDAERRCADANAERAGAGLPLIEYGVGLHLGDVIYGNIGLPDRLEFSVIGAAANEAARLEGQTKVSGRRVIASRAFADNLDIDWDDLGDAELAGVGEAMRLFAPRGLGYGPPPSTSVPPLVPAV
ncbi:MAG: adenylate/guanylate cyclase domain-containing protein [Rhodospirillales bacterium]|jgi:adenylate cyclase|nr:adenylate/guanylate cyclase domain-containing protein [Rhodospirillales bacterium]MDP6644095.1 adenylate/guanylate cyclase domain-containing protein [Rhodospirillales bacterium]MDP6841147.1 adenylate/guanylate cyclase domain-containing protein [Rhodospirillales bacterium]